MALSFKDMMVNEPVHILYTNWRGETSVRCIHPQVAEGGGSHIWRGATKWHPELQWFLHAVDVEKGCARDFALSGIHAWGEDAILQAEILAADLDVMRKALRIAEAVIQCPEALSRIRSALRSEGNAPGAPLWAAGLARDRDSKSGRAALASQPD